MLKMNNQRSRFSKDYTLEWKHFINIILFNLNYIRIEKTVIFAKVEYHTW